MNVMPVLRGLDERAKTESTPEYDRLMADCGSLLAEAPWQPQLLKFQPWNKGKNKLAADYVIPDDYELRPAPIHLAVRSLERLISSRFDTQLMQVIC